MQIIPMGALERIMVKGTRTFIAAVSLMALVAACNDKEKPSSNVRDKRENVEKTVTEKDAKTRNVSLVKNKKDAEEFYRNNSVEFDDVWIPGKIDTDRINQALTTFLRNSFSTENDAWRRKGYSFVLDNLKRYRREYSGLVLKNKKRLFCNMFILEYPAIDFSGRFTTILDGGFSVVRFTYDIESEKIVDFVWNYGTGPAKSKDMSEK